MTRPRVTRPRVTRPRVIGCDPVPGWTNGVSGRRVCGREVEVVLGLLVLKQIVADECDKCHAFIATVDPDAYESISSTGCLFCGENALGSKRIKGPQENEEKEEQIQGVT